MKTAEKVSVLLTMPVALLSPPMLLFPPFPGAMATISSCVCWALWPLGSAWWERVWGNAALGQEGWDFGADIYQVLFCCSPRRQVLPSSRSVSLQLVPGQMFPAGDSPGPDHAPGLSSSPYPLLPCPRALLFYQPALPGTALLWWCPSPSCTESQLGTALCVNLGLYPATAGAPRAPRSSTRGSANSHTCFQ